jgi:DNA-binding HxlR family transcriptional regulator
MNHLTPQDDLERLTTLTRLGWTLAMLVTLAELDGASAIELRTNLGVSSATLGRTIEHAMAQRWVRSVADRGRSLRREYELTGPRSGGGDAASVHASSIIEALALADLAPADVPRWALPALAVLVEGPTRYSGIERKLPTSNPRALTASMKWLVDQRLVERIVDDRHPPGVTYRPEPSATGLMRVLTPTTRPPRRDQ